MMTRRGSSKQVAMTRRGSSKQVMTKKERMQQMGCDDKGEEVANELQ